MRNEAGAGARQSGRFQMMDTDVTTVNIESASNSRYILLTLEMLDIGTTTPAAHLQIEKASGTTLALSNSGSVNSGTRGELAVYNLNASTVANYKSSSSYR